MCWSTGRKSRALEERCGEDRRKKSFKISGYPSGEDGKGHWRVSRLRVVNLECLKDWEKSCISTVRDQRGEL